MEAPKAQRCYSLLGTTFAQYRCAQSRLNDESPVARGPRISSFYDRARRSINYREIKLLGRQRLLQLALGLHPVRGLISQDTQALASLADKVRAELNLLVAGLLCPLGGNRTLRGFSAGTLSHRRLLRLGHSRCLFARQCHSSRLLHASLFFRDLFRFVFAFHLSAHPCY